MRLAAEKFEPYEKIKVGVKKMEHIYDTFVERSNRNHAQIEAYNIILTQELERLVKAEEVNAEKIKLQIEKVSKQKNPKLKQQLEKQEQASKELVTKLAVASSHYLPTFAQVIFWLCNLLSKLFILQKMMRNAAEDSEEHRRIKMCIVSGKYKYDSFMELVTEDHQLAERIYSRTTQQRICALINLFPRKAFADMLKRTGSKDYFEKLDAMVLKEK